LHLAAESHVDRSITDPLAFVKTNVIGTMNLLNAAKTIWKDDLEGKRFTILARMRFMEALVLKDYLQKRQHMILILLILHPKRAQITLLGLW
jgi:hypothetical protein